MDAVEPARCIEAAHATARELGVDPEHRGTRRLAAALASEIQHPSAATHDAMTADTTDNSKASQRDRQSLHSLSPPPAPLPFIREPLADEVNAESTQTHAPHARSETTHSSPRAHDQPFQIHIGVAAQTFPEADPMFAARFSQEK